MDKDIRRLLEDVGLAKTVKDVSDLKRQGEELEKSIEELNYNQKILINERERERERAEETETEKHAAQKGCTFFHLGEDCFEKKKWSEAIKHYEVAVKSFPRDWIFTETRVFSQKMALFRMAQCLLNANKIDESIQILESIFENIKDFAADNDYLNLQIPEIKSEMAKAFERKLGELLRQHSDEEGILNEVNILKYRLFQIDPEKYRVHEPIYLDIKQKIERKEKQAQKEKEKQEKQKQLKEQIQNLFGKKEDLLAYSKSGLGEGIVFGVLMGAAVGGYCAHKVWDDWGSLSGIIVFIVILLLGVFIGWLGGKRIANRKYKNGSFKIDKQIKEIQTELLNLL